MTSAPGRDSAAVVTLLVSRRALLRACPSEAERSDRAQLDPQHHETRAHQVYRCRSMHRKRSTPSHGLAGSANPFAPSRS